MAQSSHFLRGRAARPAAALAALALATGCIASRRPIVLDSSPPGAEVFIDGASSGHSTPCAIQLPNRARTFEFRLDGYQTEVRQVVVGERSEVVYYLDGFTNITTWPFPLFLGAKDFFFPIKVDDGEFPSRIHVRFSRTRAARPPQAKQASLRTP
ncbi:MAG: PEGA domain-containing protein [Planctomycetota bacterium]